MTYIDPILFSGGAQIKAYTDGRVKDWEDMKMMSTLILTITLKK